jgi:hypothetical protein
MDRAARERMETTMAKATAKATARVQAKGKVQQKKKAAVAARKPAKGGRAVDPEAMMEAWRKAASPGEGHRRLEPLVGTWNVRTTFTMTPGEPPQVSGGTSEHRWVLGGRYLEQRYKGTAMDMPFEGLGYTAYDNTQKKYFGAWMDSCGTGLMTSVGTGRPTDSKIDFDSETCDPSGGRAKVLCTIRIQDRDHHTYEMWAKAPNGKRYRTMLIEYKRK